MQQGFDLMDKRFEIMQAFLVKCFEQVDKCFEQVDKRFEQVDRRFEELTGRIDTFMRWSFGLTSFGLTLTVRGIIIAVLKFT